MRSFFFSPFSFLNPARKLFHTIIHFKSMKPRQRLKTLPKVGFKLVQRLAGPADSASDSLLYSSMKIFFVFPIIFLLASCQEKAIYNQYVDLDEEGWKLDSLIDFEFEIENSSKPVNLFYNIRNDVSYPFYNLYVKYELTDQNGEIVRSNMHEANLMDPTTGAPIGTGESLFDNQILLLKNFQFPESGNYKFSIKQYMREEKIDGIWAVGLTIREVGE